MSATSSHMITALDVGSSKIACFIGSVDDEGGIGIPGMGVRSCRGVRSGAVVDIAETEHAMRSAVEQAERMAGVTVDEVIVSVSAGDLESHIVEVETEIEGHRVEESDLRHALSQARASITLTDREVIHAFPACFALDGIYGVRAPIGLYGERLATTLHVVTARAAPLRNLRTCVERAHLRVRRFVAAPYASGLATLVEDEMQLGAAVVDIGAGTTDVAIFAGGAMVFASVLPLGGNHVTQDIARGLLTPVDQAERLKTLHGQALSTAADDRETIDVPQLGEGDYDPDGYITVPRSRLSRIIEPRLAEILELVRDRLEAGGFAGGAARRVVLTGAASQLPAMRDLAQRILDKQVRLGRPSGLTGLAAATAGPGFATTAGLLLHSAKAPPESAAPRSPVSLPAAGGGLARLGRWLRENL
ncbi:MAG: cell division protein FtsA [Rhodothalassiaceae bacterium]